MPRLYNTKRDIIDFLIEDELEAVQGYEDAIAATEDSDTIEALSHIKDEELQHIEELKILKGN